MVAAAAATATSTAATTTTATVKLPANGCCPLIVKFTSTTNEWSLLIIIAIDDVTRNARC